ncbi:MAG TPA: hypothetical protein VFC31_08745 [Candidatus Limnocylindria bacterium]|nr:hypothetical protein [Candidatus Limnocylindria bacterium]
MSVPIGSAVRDPRLRAAGETDPIHASRYHGVAPVDGRGGMNISGPYEPVLGWPVPAHPGEWRTGSGRGVIALSPDRVIAVYGGEVPEHGNPNVWGVDTFRDLRFTEVNAKRLPAHRHCHEIVVYDRAGRIVGSWDRWLDALHEEDVRHGRTPKSGHVNRVRVDPNDPARHVWIVGLGNTGVFKFTSDGSELVMKLDARNVPEEYHPFVYAQDVAFLPDGDIVVAHLHHLMRFTHDGRFVSAIGGQGRGPLEFDGIHDVQVHPRTHRLFVNDRVNQRIQILEPDGTFVDEWGGFQGVYAIRFTADGRYLWAGNGFAHKFLKYDMEGRLVRAATWGTFGIAPGALWGPHYFDTDRDGNLYVAEDYSGRVQKLRPMADAEADDPQLVGRLAP